MACACWLKVRVTWVYVLHNTGSLLRQLDTFSHSVCPPHWSRSVLCPATRLIVSLTVIIPETRDTRADCPDSPDYPASSGRLITPGHALQVTTPSSPSPGAAPRPSTSTTRRRPPCPPSATRRCWWAASTSSPASPPPSLGQTLSGSAAGSVGPPRRPSSTSRTITTRSPSSRRSPGRASPGLGPSRDAAPPRDSPRPRRGRCRNCRNCRNCPPCSRGGPRPGPCPARQSRRQRMTGSWA